MNLFEGKVIEGEICLYILARVPCITFENGKGIGQIISFRSNEYSDNVLEKYYVLPAGLSP